MVQVSKTVSLSANAYTDVDVSQFVSAGKTIFGISAVMLGDYYLPYFGSNNSRTWAEHVYPDTNKVRIQNTASAWTNYVLTFVLFVV
jgi:hypothetical protein